MQTAPPVLPAIISEFNVSFATAGTMMLFVALPGAILSIIGGKFVSRFGDKRSGVVGVLVVVLGTLICAAAPSFVVLQLGRFIVGISGVFLFISMPSLLSKWFPREEQGISMGIFALCMPVATVVAFNSQGKIQEAFNWRFSFLVAFIFALIVLILFLVLVKDKQGPAPGSTSVPSSDNEAVQTGGRVLTNPKIWLLGMTWMAFNLGAISYTTWGKTVFTELVLLSPSYADFLAGMFMLGGFLTPVAGAIFDRTHRYRWAVSGSLIIMAAAFFFIPYSSGPGLLLTTAVLGIAGAFLPPVVFILPIKILGEKNASQGFGIINTCLNLGILLGPVSVGAVADVFFDKGVIFTTMAVFLIVSLGLSLSLRIKY